MVCSTFTTWQEQASQYLCFEHLFCQHLTFSSSIDVTPVSTCSKSPPSSGVISHLSIQITPNDEEGGRVSERLLGQTPNSVSYLLLNIIYLELCSVRCSFALLLSGLLAVAVDCPPAVARARLHSCAPHAEHLS